MNDVESKRDVVENNMMSDLGCVDLTKIIHEFITNRNCMHVYYIACTRFFEKSLLLSMIKDVFLGNRERFSDLWIGTQAVEYEWKKYPVIWLDFARITYSTPDELDEGICQEVENVARDFGIQALRGYGPGMMLADLVDELAVGGKVVLLIDNFDKAIIDHKNDEPLTAKYGSVLNSFNSAIKSLAADWRAVFIAANGDFRCGSMFSGDGLLTVACNRWRDITCEIHDKRRR